MIFFQMSKDRLMTTEADFLLWICQCYMNKNKGIQHLFPKIQDKERISDVLETRGLIKAFKGVENETLPLPSVLKLHIARADFPVILDGRKLGAPLIF